MNLPYTLGRLWERQGRSKGESREELIGIYLAFEPKLSLAINFIANMALTAKLYIWDFHTNV
ncbi:hypothetical protein SAMN04489723_11416 [Algoriphagus aquimarinus]|uniref:Uncharacterized protein n=1 Tax=Algoriphagus aquimarinus TaxID=237018 RepID=A0A1I1BHR0_9BACT|nr:hypothetical protein SAMN04489723_11416 [Algoriphagus aquimarinus]